MVAAETLGLFLDQVGVEELHHLLRGLHPRHEAADRARELPTRAEIGEERVIDWFGLLKMGGVPSIDAVEGGAALVEAVRAPVEHALGQTVMHVARGLIQRRQRPGPARQQHRGIVREFVVAGLPPLLERVPRPARGTLVELGHLRGDGCEEAARVLVLLVLPNEPRTVVLAGVRFGQGPVGVEIVV